MTRKQKKLIAGQVPSSKPLPSLGKVSEYKECCFNWSLGSKYLWHKAGDKFCFCDVSADNLKKVVTKLNDFRSCSWRKMEQHDECGGGSIPIYTLERDIQKMVQEHLKSCDLMNHDELFRVRIDSSHRVWGIRIGEVFHLIWNDEEHLFYKTR